MASMIGGGQAPDKVLHGRVVGLEGGEERGRRPEARLRLRHGLVRAVLLVECLGGHVLLGAPVLLRRKCVVVACACRSRRSARYHPTPDLLQCSSLPPAHSNSAVLGASAGMAGLGGTSFITALHISDITRICMPAALRSLQGWQRRCTLGRRANVGLINQGHLAPRGHVPAPFLREGVPHCEICVPILQGTPP